MLLQPYYLELINKTLKLIVALFPVNTISSDEYISWQLGSGSGSGRMEAKNEAKARARAALKQVPMG